MEKFDFNLKTLLPSVLLCCVNVNMNVTFFKLAVLPQSKPSCLRHDHRATLFKTRIKNRSTGNYKIKIKIKRNFAAVVSWIHAVCSCQVRLRLLISHHSCVINRCHSMDLFIHSSSGITLSCLGSDWIQEPNVTQNTRLNLTILHAPPKTLCSRRKLTNVKQGQKTSESRV